MKTKYAFLVAIMFCSYVMVSQTTHTIILKCNTSKIESESIKNICNFGQDPGVSNKDYTILVNKGDIVVWKGIATNDQYSSSLKLEQVNYEGGKNLFGRNTLKGQNGIIVGEVVQGQPGEEEKYNLKFKVYVDGKKVNGMYKIDPKIRVRL